ncbi:hypothetical protein GCM10009616_28980 [Microlunatus lacustris]
MMVSVDPDSSVPVFEQLREQIERLIRAGQLRPGTHLPTIRHLATDLGLARGTVNKVYELLARDGWVRSAGRHGTVVQTPPVQATATSDLAAAADRLALIARQLGLGDDDAQAALTRALDRLPSR